MKDRPRSPGFGVTLFRRLSCRLFGMLAESDRIENLEASISYYNSGTMIPSGCPQAGAGVRP
jgi:hypothetical protein